MPVHATVWLSLLGLGGLLWLGFGAAAVWVDLTHVPAPAPLRVSAILLPLPGLFFGVGMTLAFLRFANLRFAPDAVLSPAIAAVLLVLVEITVLLCLGGGVISGEIEASRAALLSVCGTIALVLTYHSLESLRRTDGIAFETHWGGLGGGLGGWRLSRTAVLLLLWLAVGAATIGVALGQPVHTLAPSRTAGEKPPAQQAVGSSAAPGATTRP